MATVFSGVLALTGCQDYTSLTSLEIKVHTTLFPEFLNPDNDCVVMVSENELVLPLRIWSQTTSTEKAFSRTVQGIF